MGTIILAVLSSTVLSDTIKTTLKKEPTRIEISIQSGNEKKQLIFEGPNIKTRQKNSWVSSGSGSLPSE